ncbi:DUF2335 domain-containing protein [Mycobacterium sp. CSUR Q5927]|nr:DUF2335 domain-containing protein [Mycobacterium sp. CSUR Q5927]
MSHDNVEAEGGTEEGADPRGRHDDDHPAENVDASPSTDDVGAGDDSPGDPNNSVSRQRVTEDLDQVEEILDAEVHPTEPIIDGELADEPHEMMVTTERWNGPLPPPAALREYEDICPGAADRVLRMAERQIDIREARERTVRMGLEGEIQIQQTLATGDSAALKRGQYLAAGVSALVACVSLAGMSVTPWAAIGFAVPLAQVATSLIRTITDGHHTDRGGADELEKSDDPE